MATSKNFKKRRKSFAKKKSFQKKIIIIFCNLLDVEFSKNLLQRKRIQEKKCFANKSFSRKRIFFKKSFVNIFFFKKGIFKKERKKNFQDKY